MAVAAQAALLDELMGKGRNVALGNSTLPHWTDEEICKNFLAGLCPNDLFTNTKDDLGVCDKVHDQSMLESYQKSKRFTKMKYEEKLCLYLKDLISSVEIRIRRGQTRLKRNGNLVHSNYNSEREDKLEELNDKINDTLTEVEKLGIEGKVQESQVLLELAESLKAEKTRLEKEIEIYNLQAKELEVCLICGAFQVKGDAQQRIEEHLQGKMHIGYAQIRQYLSDFNSKSKKSKNNEGDLEKNRRSDSRTRNDKKKRKTNRSNSYKKDHKHEKDDNHKRKRSRSRDRRASDTKQSKPNYQNGRHNSKSEKDSRSYKHRHRK